MASTQLSHIPLEDLYRLLKPVTLNASSPRAKFTNWGQTFTCTPLAVFVPELDYQCELILELGRRERKVVRAVGVGHSPSDLACTTEFMVRTDRLDKILEINSEKTYVIAQGGITLHALHASLAEHGLAMMNVGSISDQTLAGIVATATHGSGLNYGVISTHVLALTLLLADGSRVVCSRTENTELFMASICGLGSTGFILNITLEVEPAYRLREDQESIPFETCLDRLDTLVPSAEHVRLWWFPASDAVRVSVSNRTNEDANPFSSWLWHSFFGFHVVQLLLFLGRFVPSINTYTGQLAAWLVSEPSYGIDVGHKIFNVDCRYPQHTTEWSIPYHNTHACLRELRAWLDEERADPQGLRPHFPLEIRFSAADDIWLSPSSGCTTTWIGIIQYKPYGFNVPYRKLFARYESILARHGGRPHWAKAHGMRPETLRALYPHFEDYKRVLETVDPEGMFRNEYVQRHIFGKSGGDVDARVFKPEESKYH